MFLASLLCKVLCHPQSIDICHFIHHSKQPEEVLLFQFYRQNSHLYLNDDSIYTEKMNSFKSK